MNSIRADSGTWQLLGYRGGKTGSRNIRLSVGRASMCEESRDSTVGGARDGARISRGGRSRSNFINNLAAD